MNKSFEDLTESINVFETTRHKLFKSQNDLACIFKLLKYLTSLLSLNEKFKHIILATFCNVDELDEQVSI